MNAKLDRQPKKSFRREGAFPWSCYHCGQDQVFLTTISYDAEVRHDDRVHSFSVPSLQILACKACGEKIFDESVSDQIYAALRAHRQLLTPADMRAALDRLGLTEKAAAERLGIAEELLARWLNDFEIQPLAMDNLLRVFFAFPEVRAALDCNARDPQLGMRDVGDHAPGRSSSRPAATVVSA